MTDAQGFDRGPYKVRFAGGEPMQAEKLDLKEVHRIARPFVSEALGWLYQSFLEFAEMESKRGNAEAKSVWLQAAKQVHQAEGDL